MHFSTENKSCRPPGFFTLLGVDELFLIMPPVQTGLKYIFYINISSPPFFIPMVCLSEYLVVRKI